MGEKNFKEKVYEKCIDVVQTHRFPPEWDTFLRTRVRVADLFNLHGPAPGAAEGLFQFRKHLYETAANEKMSVANLIVNIAKSGQPYSKWNTRAAFLKVLLHFSRRANRAAQEVWIFSPPTAYWRWIFDLLNGTDAKVLMWLEKDDEVYSDEEKSGMLNALQMALHVTQKAVHRLGQPDQATQALVARWFVDGDIDSSALLKMINVLQDGFKQISAVCNSTRLIFADDPFDRTSPVAYARKFGSVSKGGEGGLIVMYLAGGFKANVNSGRLWLCTQTIIHEAAHIAIGAEDILYDKDGLKPRPGFNREAAIRNADSWGYFALDLAGFLSPSDFRQIWSDFGH
jgi:Lysine-specific metallo-endopeptidase